MKTIAFIFLVLAGSTSFGQVKEASNSRHKEPVYFLDSIKISKNQLFFSPDKIAAINVAKSDNSGQDNGRIYIKLKNPKDLKLMDLNEIVRNYLQSNADPKLFMIDNKILQDDISSCKIDSSYVLAVEVLKGTEIKSLQNSFSNFTIYNIRLKTKENLAKANEIYIRGADVTKVFNK